MTLRSNSSHMFPSLLSVGADEQEAMCVAVVDVVNSTELAARLPLARFSALMVELLEGLSQHTTRTGGEVLQQQGDSLIALWPCSQAGAALKALRGMPEIARTVSRAHLGQELELRMALSCGDVLRAEVSGQATAYGLALHLARRLCEAGEPGQLLACPAFHVRLPHYPWQPLAVQLRSFAPLQCAMLSRPPSQN